jgi:hypothetical protein
MAAHLISFWNKDGERKLRTEVLEFVPRIGESVSITLTDDTYLQSTVTLVCYSIPKPALRGESVDVRINVFLNLE